MSVHRVTGRPPKRLRLDAELVRRGLARSREHAGALIDSGRISVAGAVRQKAASQVDSAAAIVVAPGDAGPDYVSRGAHKLLGALGAFGPRGLAIDGRVCLDAGASTGGFTQVLLQAGASRVFAVDVGYGQLAWALQSDDRVVVKDRCNIRDLTPADLDDEPEVVVGDLSFISLRLVLQALRSVARPGADFVLMVKPQFEVGRERLGAGGVVRSPDLRAEVVHDVAIAAAALGLGTGGVTASPLPGPAGNVEYFLWLREGSPAPQLDDIVRAVADGPS